MESKPWVLLITRNDLYEAHLAKAILESANIPVLIPNDASAVFGYYDSREELEIYVPPQFKEQALKALEEYEKEEEKPRYDFWKSGEHAG